MAQPRRARWLWATLPVVAGFAVFGVIVWLAYEDTSGGPPVGEPPLIKASADSIKLPPDEAEESTVAEGGAVGRLWSDAERTDQPERLLPLPEEPLSPPVVADRGTSAEPAPLPSGATPATDQAAAGATTAPQRSPDKGLQEAEVALDRLLAEVAALSEEQSASPGATTPPEPGAGAEPPAESPPAVAAEVDTAALPEEQPAAPGVATPAPSEPEATSEPPTESSPAATAAVDTASLPEQQPTAARMTSPAPSEPETSAKPPAESRSTAAAEAETAAPPEEQSAAPGATAPAPIKVGASAESPAAAQAETATPAPARPVPDRPVRPSRVASEQTQPTEPPAADTPEIRRASALSVPPSPPQPAPRESARTRPTQVAAIEDNFRIQLAAVREESDARRAWDLFSGDLKPVLSDVRPFFERAETANGVFYRVQIGPFATQEAAESLCDEIKQRNASCFVIRR